MRGVIAGVLNSEALIGCDGAGRVLLPPTADKLDNSFVSMSRSTMTCCGVCSILMMVGEEQWGKENALLIKVRFIRQEIAGKKDRQILAPDGGFTCRTGILAITVAQDHLD